MRVWNIREEELRARMHVLGNLSALPSEINVKSSNKKFSDKKKQALDSTDATGTKLQNWTENDRWTPLMIDERTTDIIEKMIKRWPDPSN
jgi:hypothetical protein